MEVINIISALFRFMIKSVDVCLFFTSRLYFIVFFGNDIVVQKMLCHEVNRT